MPNRSRTGSAGLFDKAACVEKAIQLTEEAATKGVEVVVFPELFVPGYPDGMTFGFTVAIAMKMEEKTGSGIMIIPFWRPGPETDRLGQVAKTAGVYLSIGVSEREEETATLYNSNLFFSPEGKLAAVHRKLKPTGSERVVWGDAKSHYFPVMETPWGPMGSLICWESYMPLARVALYQKGITLYISPNTNNNEEWQSTIRHIAIEGHCYFINSNMYTTRDMYPEDLCCKEEIQKLPDIVCRGGSCVVDPYGHYVTQPVWDREEIILADLDMDKVPMSRMEFDACGHYARPDVLELRVHEGETEEEK